MNDSSPFSTQFFTAADVTILFVAMLFVAIFGFLIVWLINFIPIFIRSVVCSVQNKSIIYDNDYVDSSQLDQGQLEKGEMGNDENFARKWFNKVKAW